MATLVGEEPLIDVEQRAADAVPRRDVIFRTMLHVQQERLITDVFTLLAVVLRERVGQIQIRSDTMWDTLIRLKNLQIFCFAFFGIICNVAIASVLWYGNDKLDAEGYRYRDDQFTSEVQKRDLTRFVALVMLQIALSLSTIVCCVLLIQRTMLLVQEKRRLWSGLGTEELLQVEEREPIDVQRRVVRRFEQAYSFFQSDYRWKLAAELLIHVIHPVIWLNEESTQLFFRILEVLIFARFYNVARIVFLFSRQHRLRSQILSSNIELQRAGSVITELSTLKMIFFAHPVLVSIVILLFVNGILGFVMFIAERTSQPRALQFGSLENAFWFTFVTFTTIGYGDLVPTSQFGRLVAAVVAGCGVIAVAVFTGIVANLAVQSREQLYVTEYMNIVGAARECRVAAASLIQAAYRNLRKRRGDTIEAAGSLRTGHRSNYVYAAIKRFKRARWAMTKATTSANDPVIDTKLNRIKEDLFKCVTHLEKHEKSVTATIDNVQQLTVDVLRLLAAPGGHEQQRQQQHAAGRPPESGFMSAEEEAAARAAAAATLAAAAAAASPFGSGRRNNVMGSSLSSADGIDSFVRSFVV